MKIDETTSIPIAWFATMMGVVISTGALVSFWVFSVDARLTRIEEKLGIKDPIAHVFVSVENISSNEVKKQRGEN